MVKIGVVLDDKENIASLQTGTKVSIYQFIDSNWKQTSEINKCFENKLSLQAMRQFVYELIKELDDCKILIGTVITGIPYMILDNAKFFMCEADVLSDSLLTTVAIDYDNYLKKQIKDNRKPNNNNSYPDKPYETEVKGHYEFDLRKFQESCPTISSKKVFIPFFKEVEFKQLTVYCNHVMPWFDFDLRTRGLTYTKEKVKDECYKVVVLPISK